MASRLEDIINRKNKAVQSSTALSGETNKMGLERIVNGRANKEETPSRPLPTMEQLQRQYNRYSNRYAGNSTENKPKKNIQSDSIANTDSNTLRNTVREIEKRTTNTQSNNNVLNQLQSIKRPEYAENRVGKESFNSNIADVKTLTASKEELQKRYDSNATEKWKGDIDKKYQALSVTEKGIVDKVVGMNTKYYDLINNGGDEDEIKEVADELDIYVRSLMAYQDPQSGETVDMTPWLNDFVEAGVRDMELEASAKKREKTKEYAKEHPILGTVASIGSNIASVLDAPEIVEDLVRQRPLNTADLPFSNYTSDIRDTVSENMGGVGKFAYGVGTSMADFLASSAIGSGVASGAGSALGLTDEATAVIGKVLPLSIMSSSAAVSTTKDASSRGADINHAVITGTLAGVAEAVFEKYSIENLRGLQASNPKALKDIATNIVKSMATEGTEELFTDVANEVSDRIINQDLSSYELSVKEYIANGMTESEAKKKAGVDFAKQLGLSFLGGAASGGAIGSFYGAKGGIQQYNAGKQSDADYNQYTEISDNREDYTTQEQYEKAIELKGEATRLSNKKDAGEEISSLEKGNFERLDYEYLSTVTPTIEETEDIEESQEREEVQDVNDTQFMSNAQAIEDMPSSNIVDDSATNERIGSMKEDSKTRLSRLYPNVSDSQFESEFTYKNEVVAIDGISMKDDKLQISVRTPEGNVKIAGIKDIQTDSYTKSLLKFGESLGINGARAYISNFQKNPRLKIEASDYTLAFTAYYNAGLKQKSFDSVNMKPGIDYMQAQQAYFAGTNDFTGINQQTGGVVRNNARSKVNERTVRVLDIIGEATGTTIQFDEVLTADANGTYYDGVVHLSLNSDKNHIVVFCHELTHQLKATSLEDYKKYEKFIIDYMQNEHADEYRKRKAQIELLYRRNGVELDENAINEEIVANATEMFLTDAKSIETLVRTDKTLAQKVLDVINKIIKDIKAQFSNYQASTIEGRLIRENVEVFEEARNLWVKAIENQTRDEVQAKERQESKKTGQELYYDLKQSAQDDDENHVVTNFDNIVDEIRKGGYKKYNGLVKIATTPKIIQTLFDIPELDMMMTAKHIYTVSNSEKYASQSDHITKSEMKKAHMHNLSKEIFKKAIDKSTDPLLILKADNSNRNTRIVEIVDVQDKNGNTIIIPININTVGRGVSKMENVNIVLSVYGRENIDTFIRKAIEERRVLYSKKSSQTNPVKQGYQLPKVIETFDYSQNIARFRKVVKGEINKNEPFNDLEKIDLEEVKKQAELGKKIKMSLKEYDNTNTDALIVENGKLRKTVRVLESQLEYGKQHYTGNKAQLSTLADTMLSRYRSDYKKADFTKNMNAIVEYIQNSRDVDGAEVTKMTTALAKEILDASIEVDDSMEQIYPYLKKQIRTTPLALRDEYRDDMQRVGGYNQFRKDYFGRIQLVKDGRSIDSFYQELNQEYPELFPDNQVHPADQLIMIADVIDMLKPQISNNYGANVNEMAAVVSQEIYQELFNINTENVTFSKAQRDEVNKIKSEYKQSIRQYKRDLQKKYFGIVRDLERTKNYNSKLLDAQAKHYDKINETKQRWQDRLDNNKYKTRIYKTSKEFAKWLENPTDAKHIPEVLKEDASRFMGSIDFISDRMDPNSDNTRRWTEVMLTFQNQMANYEKGDITNELGQDIVLEIDPDYINRLEAFIKGNNDVKKLSELDVNGLRELEYLVSILKRTVTNYNRLFANQRFKHIDEAGDATIEYLMSKKDKTIHNKYVNRVDNLLNVDMLDSRSYFERLGEGGMSIYSELRKGIDDRTWRIKEAQDYMKDNVLKDVDIHKWTGKKADTKTFRIDGKDVELTIGEMMTIYNLSKRPQAKEHILKGGLVRDEEVLRTVRKDKKLNAASVLKTNEFDIVEIINALTDEQRKVADQMMKYLSTEVSEWGNDVTMKLYGYTKFNEKNYWPIRSDSDYTRTESKQENTSAHHRIKNMSMTKSTVKKANNTIVIQDVFDVYTEHISQMATYNGLCIPVTDAMHWFNYKTINNMGEVDQKTESIKKHINETYGKAFQKYYDNLIKDINGMTARGYSTEISSSLLSRVKTASVGANIRVAIQQPTAYVRALDIMDAKYLTKALTMKPNSKKAMENSAIAVWKSWGYYETMIGKSMKEVITGTSSGYDKVINASMKLAELGDEVTWGTLWNACEVEVKEKHSNVEYDSNEFILLVSERFNEVIDKTQVVDTVLHRSQIMRSQDGLSKLVTAFMSEPTKTYNMLLNAVRTKDGKRITRIAITLMLANVANAAAQSAVDALRDDEDERYTEKYIRHLKDNFKGNSDPLALVAYGKDFVSILQGYEVKRTEMQGMENIANGLRTLYKYIEDPTYKKNAYGVAKDMAQGASQITGIPVYSLMRDAEAVINTIWDGAISTTKDTKAEITEMLYDAMVDGDKGDIEEYQKKLQSNIKNTREKQLKKAEDSGDETEIDKAREKLTDEEIQKAIKNEVKKALKNNDDRINEAAQARVEGDTSEYMKIAQDIINDGFNQDIVVSAINSVVSSITTPSGTKSTKDTSMYKASDVVLALKNDNLGEALNTVQEIYNERINNGKTITQIRSSVKSSITSEYKIIYQEAYQNKDFDKMRSVQNLLLKVTVNGSRLYKLSDIQGWKK